MIVQEYISEANQQDIRVFIVGGKIVASMKRTACKGDVRVNTSNGGTGSLIKLTGEETKLATRTAKIFKLDIAGIDIIRSNNGPLILEVNSNPGFKELQKITNIDIADLIIKFAINSVVKAKK
jgi:ribosomal protein S6--L-glutamate ligase